MRTLLLLAAAALLAGCAVKATPVYLADGRPAYYIACGRGIAQCYEKAAEICPAGYSLISHETSATGLVIGGLATANVGNPADPAQIYVRCKAG